MYLKLWFFIAIFICYSLTLFAQNKTEKEDVLYLKNGSVIRGSIIEQQIGESVKIELLGGSIFVFKQTEIDSIKKENKIAQSKTEKPEYYIKQKGFRIISETGIITGISGSGEYYNNPFDIGAQLHMVSGWQFNRFLFAGGGAGVEKMAAYRQGFAPFYARLSSDFLKKRTTPYVFTDMGYALFWDSDEYLEDYSYYKNKGGFYLQAGGGVKIFTRSKAAINVGLAYKRLSSESDWQYNYEGSPKYNMKRTYQRMVILVGVNF